MQGTADPVLAAAILKDGTAIQWREWRSIVGPHASPQQVTKLWQDLGTSGAKQLLVLNLMAVQSWRIARDSPLQPSLWQPLAH